MYLLPTQRGPIPERLVDAPSRDPGTLAGGPVATPERPLSDCEI
jgi:hypothetical protein